MREIIIYLVVAYLLGSIPFGLFAGFLAGKDIRKHGSGNIGFTNILRVCGAKWGIPVLALDVLKGAAAVLLARVFLDSQAADFHWQEVFAGLMAVSGHSFPIWLKFRGGKGVATGAGVAAVIIPHPLIAAIFTWIIVVALFRYVSLGSIAAALVTFSAQIILSWGEVWSHRNAPGLLLAIAIMVVVIGRHRSNIRRLFTGTENKFSVRKAKSENKTKTK